MDSKKRINAITVTLTCLLAAGGLIGVSRLNKPKTEEVKADINPNYGKPIYNSTAKTVTYGLYPQTVVTDSTLLDALDALDDSAKIASVDWYLYEGNYYKYVSSANPYGTNYKYNNGDNINKGASYWFKCEPITWKVLKTSGTKHICVSNVILDRFYFYIGAKRTIGGQTVYKNNYRYSMMRGWLNGLDCTSYSAGDYTNSGFIDVAFGLDTIDTSYILTTEVDNSLSSTGDKSNTYVCANTNDKVWLLSRKEVSSIYFKSNNARKAKSSDYGLARGSYFGDNNAYYMLRSPANSNVNSFGQAYYDVQGNGVVSYGLTDSNCEGTRPVMQFNTINATDVIERINNIGTVEYTSECKSRIDSARSGYNALDNEQKALVTNYDTLVAAETEYGNMDAAANATNLINAIGTVTYPDSKGAINSARTAYDTLTDEQKSLVTNLATLTDAETAYGNLRDLAVQNVINSINAIGTVSYPEPDSGEDINAARTAYNNLDSNDVSLVTNYDVLVQDEETYKNLKDNYLANNVKTLIDNIGEVTFTKESKDKIDAAREAYDALTSDQQPLVDNYQDLVDAETEYQKLVDNHAAADAVEAIIDAIGEVALTDESKGKIDDAREAYEALESDQQPLVENYQDLVDAENQYQKLVDDDAAANVVEGIIDAIGEVTFTTDSKDKIDDAREAYDALTSDQKPFVENYSTLTAAEAKYAELEAAGNDYLIDNETGVEIKTSDGTTVPENIELRVEVRTSVSAQQGSEDYEAIKTKIGDSKQISGVYDVKLIRKEGDVETEIQPSDIKEGMTITVIMTVPEGVTGEFEILHIHSSTEMDYVTNFTVNGNKVSFSISKLSEFAFVTVIPVAAKAGLPGWAIALIVIFSVLLAICGAYFLLFFAFNKWIKEEDDATRVFRFGSKEGKVRLFRVPFNFVKKDGKIKFVFKPFKFVYKDEKEVFETKEEALG